MRKHECAWWSGVCGGYTSRPPPAVNPGTTGPRGKRPEAAVCHHRQTWLYNPCRWYAAAAAADEGGLHMLFPPPVVSPSGVIYKIRKVSKYFQKKKNTSYYYSDFFFFNKFKKWCENATKRKRLKIMNLTFFPPLISRYSLKSRINPLTPTEIFCFSINIDHSQLTLHTFILVL